MIIKSGKTPSYDTKKLILSSSHIGSFSKGLTHDFGQKLEITPWIVFRKIICLELMCDDLPVRTRPSWTIKKLILLSGHIGFFSKGLTHDFGQKLEITPWFGFG